jgi:hypothetical protein
MATPNYTAEQVSAITSAAEATGSLNADQAAAIAAEIGKSKRSVIAKIKSLGLDYTVQVRATKGVRDVTKAELVAAIETAYHVEADSFKGLEKATAKALNALLAVTS